MTDTENQPRYLSSVVSLARWVREFSPIGFHGGLVSCSHAVRDQALLLSMRTERAYSCLLRWLCFTMWRHIAFPSHCWPSNRRIGRWRVEVRLLRLCNTPDGRPKQMNALLSMVSPLYMAEIASPEVRGSLMALEQFSIVLGCVLGFWTGFFTRTSTSL